MRDSAFVVALSLMLIGCGQDQPHDRTAGREPVEMPILPAPDPNSSARAVAAAAEALGAYDRISGVSGSLSSAGSDTLANLMTLWSESFHNYYPSVNVQVQASGSSTAPPALTEGTANFGLMSRAMKDQELEAFESRHGYKPTALRVAIDALAIYVHKDNPINEISIRELDRIYSITRRCGGGENVKNWGDLGLRGSWIDRPIQLYGRNSVSGTYGYFKRVALCSGDFKNTVNEQPGSASVVQAISSSLNGVGYSGIGYLTSGIKTIAVSVEGRNAVAATPESAISGDYPLTRFLYIYVNKPPETSIPPSEREFLRLVLSPEGQAIVGKDGYISLSPQMAARELAKVL